MEPLKKFTAAECSLYPGFTIARFDCIANLERLTSKDNTDFRGSNTLETFFFFIFILRHIIFCVIILIAFLKEINNSKQLFFKPIFQNLKKLNFFSTFSNYYFFFNYQYFLMKKKHSNIILFLIKVRIPNFDFQII